MDGQLLYRQMSLINSIYPWWFNMALENSKMKVDLWNKYVHFCCWIVYKEMYPAYSFPDTLHIQIEYTMSGLPFLDWTSAKAKKILHTIPQGQGNIMTTATKDTKYHIMILQQNLSSFRNMYIHMCIIYIY